MNIFLTSPGVHINEVRLYTVYACLSLSLSLSLSHYLLCVVLDRSGGSDWGRQVKSPPGPIQDGGHQQWLHHRRWS